MGAFQALTASEQLAAHLKNEIVRGTWTGTMPGEARLLAELGVGQGTIRAALLQLEREGLLVPQGKGSRRQIVIPEDISPPALRVRILMYEPDDMKQHYIVDLQHRLMEAGHVVSLAPKSLTDLGPGLQKISRYVESLPAEAWVVISGTSEVLRWFSKQPTPAFALAGRRRGVDIAGTGPDKLPALRTAVRRLIELGHRRIVMLAREVRRKPLPGLFEQVFLEELQAHGITVGDYNLPHWEETPEGFRRCLEALFAHTPPTALIIEEMWTFIAARQHLSDRGIVAPRDISLICDDPPPAFSWNIPAATHIQWDSAPWARRIVNWANNIACGNDDRRQTFTKAEFVEGGTIGPAPRRR